MQYQNYSTSSTNSNTYSNSNRIIECKVIPPKMNQLRNEMEEKNYPKLLNIKYPYAIQKRKYNTVLPSKNEKIDPSFSEVANYPFLSRGDDQNIAENYSKTPVFHSIAKENRYIEPTSIITNPNQISNDKLIEIEFSQNPTSLELKGRPKPNAPDIPYISNKFIINNRKHYSNKIDYRSSRSFNDSVHPSYLNENIFNSKSNNYFERVDRIKVPSMLNYLQNYSTNVS